MKKLLIAFAFTAIFQSVTAQRARVFEHFTTSFAFGNSALVPSLSYTQSLAVGQDFGFRFSMGARYSQYILKNTATLESVSSTDNNNTLNVEKSLNSPSFNLVSGFEIGNRIIAGGINVDLVGYNLGNAKGSEFTSISNLGMPLEGFSISPRGLNFVGNGQGTLNNQIYLSVTPNPNLTIVGGVAYTQTMYTATYQVAEDQRADYGTFRERNFRPFVALQFNFEK